MSGEYVVQKARDLERYQNAEYYPARMQSFYGCIFLRNTTPIHMNHIPEYMDQNRSGTVLALWMTVRIGVGANHMSG